MTLEIEPDGEDTSGPCADCGRDTMTVWGYVADDDCARATYFIRWTEGHVERGAQLLVCIGAWGPHATGADRRSFGLEWQLPGVRLVDAAELPWQQASLGRKLSREEALGSADKAEVFAIVDAVIECDPRFRRFLTAVSS